MIEMQSRCGRTCVERLRDEQPVPADRRRRFDGPALQNRRRSHTCERCLALLHPVDHQFPAARRQLRSQVASAGYAKFFQSRRRRKVARPAGRFNTVGFHPYPEVLRLRAQFGEQFRASDPKRKSGDVMADGNVPCTARACIYDRTRLLKRAKYVAAVNPAGPAPMIRQSMANDDRTVGCVTGLIDFHRLRPAKLPLKSAASLVASHCRAIAGEDNPSD